MRIESDLARKIIFEVQSLTTENIIIINTEGTIIASTDKNRLGNTHEGAKIVMRTKEKLYVNQEMAETLNGVKPGINLPIIFEREVVGVIGITGEPANVEPFAELFRRMTELIIREANYIQRKEWETRGLEAFLHDWIYSNKIDESIINRGEIFGISFSVPYQCILFQIESNILREEQLDIQKYMEDWFNQKFTKHKNDLFVRWGHGRFILIKNQAKETPVSRLKYDLLSWKQAFQKQYNASLAIGVGKTIESRTISTSYQEAMKALNVAKKDFNITFYESLLLDIILEGIPQVTKDEYVRKVFTPLKKDSELIETLQAYLMNNQSLKQTAKQLHIHINTLNYRLNRIKNITEIDPRDSEGIATYYIGLHLMNLVNSTSNEEI